MKRKTLEKVLKIIIAILVVINVVATGMTIVTQAAQEVKVTITAKPKIDIALTQGETSLDMSNFENDLKQSLESKGIDSNRVNFKKIQMEDVSINSTDASTIFYNWGRTGWTGRWYLSGNQIINSENTDNFTGFYNNTSFDYNDIELEYDNTTTDGDDDFMGAIIRYTPNADGTCTTYVFALDRHDNGGGIGWGAYNGLLKITNKGFAMENVELVQHTNAVWTRNNWTHYRIIAKGNNIKVYQQLTGGAENLIIDYTDDTSTPIYSGSYGFFSYSQPYARFANIQIKTTSYKKLNEVINEPEWSKNTIRAIVDIADSTRDEFSTNSEIANIETKLMNEEINYIGWGTTDNQTQIQNMIKENDNKGIFINNEDYNNAIEQTAQYIKTLLENAENQKTTLIVNEPVEMQVNPENIKQNTKDINYPDGKWKVEHNYNYYENSNGQYRNSGLYTDSIISNFDKAGKYTLYYADENTNPSEIYAHRRPVAAFDASIDARNNVTLTSNSYDIDNESKNNGIAEEEWSYKKVGDNTWTAGKITNIQDGIEYVVQLRVKDFQGTWSYPSTKHLTTNKEEKPVAEFSIKEDEISLYQEMEIIDNSYDPTLIPLAEYEWKILKEDGTEVYSGGTLKTNFQEYGEGIYKVQLVVNNIRGASSDPYTRTINVTRDTTGPEMIIEPVSKELSIKPRAIEKIDINVKFIDLESGFRSYKYAFTENSEALGTDSTLWSGPITKSQDTIATYDMYKKQYLHIIAVDNEGNESEERIAGIYYITDYYTVNLQILDEDDKSPIPNATMEMRIKDDSGKIISNNEVTTDKDGNIQIKENITAGKTHTLTIIPKQIPSPYISDYAKEIEIKMDESGEITITDLDNASTLDTTEKIITVKEYLNYDKSTINIEKVSSKNESLRLKGTGIKIDGIEKETDDNGNAQIQIPAKSSGWHSISVEETYATEGFAQLKESNIQVSYNNNGEITDATSRNEKIKVQSFDKDTINLKILNDPREPYNEYRIELDVRDKEDAEIKIPNSTYKIEIADNKGGKQTVEETTDSEGKIKITGLTGQGIITVKVTQDKAPDGYKKLSAETVLTFKINDNDGTLEKIDELTSKKTNAKLWENEATIIIDAEKKEEKNQIKIELEDQDDPNTKIEGKVINLTRTEDYNNKHEETDENGVATFDKVQSLGQGDYEYKIKLDDDEFGIGEIQIVVTYDDKGKITGIRELTNKTSEISFERDEEEDYINSIAKIKIKVKETNEKQVSKIIKVDKEDPDIRLDGVAYKIKQKIKGTTRTTYLSTNVNGEIEFNLLKGDTVELTLEELKSKAKYSLDKTKKKITLTKNVRTGEMEITQIDDTIEATLDENGNIIIKDTNLKKISSQRDRKANICFFLTKKDLFGNLLGNVNFDLVETTTNKVYHLTTNEDGYVEQHDFPVPGEGTYEFYITERDPVVGYSLMNSPIKLIISYEIRDDEMKTSAVIVAKGYKYIEYKHCDEYEDDENFQLDVFMTFRNYKTGSGPSGPGEPGEPAEPGEGNTFVNIDINKFNENIDEIYGAEFEALVRYSNGTSIKVQGTPDEIRAKLSPIDVPVGETVTITLTETKAPIGYNLITEPKVVTLSRNSSGVLNVSNAYVNDNKVVEINIYDDKDTENFPPTTVEPGTPGEVSDIVPTYKIEVQCRDKENDSLIGGSTFKLDIAQQNGNNFSATRTTSMNTKGDYGRFSINGINGSGDIDIDISQISASLGHKKELTSKQVKINRTLTKLGTNNYYQLIEEKSVTGTNIKLEINNSTQTVRIIIYNEKIKLKIRTLDIDTNKKVNAGYEVYLGSSEITFSESDNVYDIAELLGETPKGTTARYTLHQSNIDNDYDMVSDQYVDITFDANGEITDAQVVGDEITKDGFDSKNCCVTIKVKKQPGNGGGGGSGDYERKPPYELIIENRERNGNHLVRNAVFNVNIQAQSGGTYARNVHDRETEEQAEDGRFLVGDISGEGNIKINITQIKAPETCKIETTTKQLELERILTKQGNGIYTHTDKINKISQSDDIQVKIEEINTDKGTYNRITITVYNERVGLQLRTRGLEDNEIVNGAQYALYRGNEIAGVVESGLRPDLQSNPTNGENYWYAFFKEVPTNQTVRYTIKETSVPGYKPANDQYIDVTFNNTGEIINANVSGDAITLDTYDRLYAQAVIKNKKIENITFKLKKTGDSKGKMPVKDAVFSINITTDSDETIRKVLNTNQYGFINIGDIDSDKIQINVKELSAPAWYKIDNEEKTITLIREKVGNNRIIKLVEDQTTEGLNLQVDESGRIVFLQVNDEIEKGFFSLDIIKEDIEDNLKRLGGAKYEVEDLSTHETYEVDGGSSLILKGKQSPGKYYYKITETEAPKDYELNQDPFYLEVEFALDSNNDPYIVDSRLLKSLGITTVTYDIGGTGEPKYETTSEEEELSEDIAEIEQQDKDYVEVHVRNKALENNIDEYYIKVVKVDRDDISIKLPGALLQLDVTNSIGQTDLSKTDVTDGEGKIMLNKVKGAGDIRIEVTELVPPPGRKFDLKEKVAKLTKDPETGRLKLIDSTNVDTIIDNKQRLITVLVRNELEDGNYELVIRKKDKNNRAINLSNVEMKVLLPGEIEPREVTTDEEGKIVFGDLPMPADGEYTYKITEIKTQDGYKPINGEIEFKITFLELGKTQQILSAAVTKGRANAEIEDVREQYVAVDVLNEKERDPENQYKIIVKKIDEQENIPIEGVKFGITLNFSKPENNKYIEALTDENGKITIDGLDEKGLVDMKIQELETVADYDFDGEEKTIVLDTTDIDNILLKENEHNLKTTIKEKEVEVEIPNKKSKEVVDLHLEKFISKINDVNQNREPIVTRTADGTFTYQKNTEKVKLTYGDLVEYTMRVYNEGETDGYAEIIMDKIPDGLEYVADNEINIKYEWEVLNETTYKTKVLSKENGEENIIKGYTDENGIDYKDVKIILRVVEKENKDSYTENIAYVVTKENPEDPPRIDGEGGEEGIIEYVKVETVKIIKTVKINTGEKTLVYNMENNIGKVELNEQMIENAEIEIEYQITATNEGTKEAKLTQIKDIIPEGMEVDLSKNSGWTKEGNEAVYKTNETLQVGESITKTIILKYKNPKYGTIDNLAYTEAEENIKEIYGEAELIIAVNPGRTQFAISLTMLTLSIICIGVCLVKKKAMAKEQDNKED